MIFLDNQPKEQLQEYKTLLNMVGSLSNLFSDSAVPYLYYRVAENAFCRAFKADNLSRSDCSADARKDKQGVGLKTFYENNGRTMQKIAEFNKARNIYKKHLSDHKRLVLEIAKMRNKRIEATKAVHGINSVLYHCVSRKSGRLLVYEQDMDTIDINKIKISKSAGGSNVVYFTDNKDEYSFNISKSTLFKRFCTPSNCIKVAVEIISDPFDLLLAFFRDNESAGIISEQKQSVMLPLYSSSKGKIVSKKSGLNQWNAGGRVRKEREVYIPIPAWIHQAFKGFFPGRDVPFKLRLPNGKTIDAKVCQDNSKALMSNPNTDLGEWLLDDILKIAPGKLVTYALLEEIGIDSVEVEKESDNLFSIYFKETGTYEDFAEQYNSG